MLRTTPDFAAILERLVAAEVDFVVIGGYAMVILGCDNQTTDIDFAFARTRENAKRLANALQEIHPKPEAWPEELPFVWDTETVFRASILTLKTDAGSVDLLGETPGVTSFSELKGESVAARVYGLDVYVASIEHLIAMKRAAGRTKDMLHIHQLEALKDELSRAKD